MWVLAEAKPKTKNQKQEQRKTPGSNYQLPTTNYQLPTTNHQ
jgi:hypothetical protein